MGVRVWGDQGCSGEEDCNCKYCERDSHNLKSKNNQKIKPSSQQSANGLQTVANREGDGACELPDSISSDTNCEFCKDRPDKPSEAKQ